MKLSHFDDLLSAARAQTETQRLLLVFAVAELPHAHSPGQARRFQEGQGGALSPVMCVDKAPSELADFATLATESDQTGQRWEVMFAAALAGRDARGPGPADIEHALKSMIGAVQRGAIDHLAAFDRHGDALRLS